MVEALVLLSAVAVAMTTVAMAAGWAEATTVAVLEEVATTSEKCQRRRSTRKKPLADCGRLKETKEIGWKEMKVDSGGRGAAGRDSEGRALPLAAIVAATTKTRVLQVGKVAEEARLAGMVEALVLLSAVAVAMTTVAMAAGWAEATTATVAVLEEVATTSEKCQRRRSTRKKPLADCGRGRTVAVLELPTGTVAEGVPPIGTVKVGHCRWRQ
ncbi:unnamed protein product [Cuscuta campestris]|uniref:VAN3-binding protein-like auxin canalisation domain-containing protein n=1 Tax=Cuscuta campestris TaxID=132261 RepID=A0A484K3E6_9ASTE|nr:unnamed protein product [Cuscuta campestris]